jgi:N-acetylmuramoyl-L-alanine amidase
MSKYCWCIDAGHAKSTPGKRSPVFPDGKTRLYEWEINRKIAAKLMYKLAEGGTKYFEVTPEDEVDIPLSRRANRVNAHDCGKPKIFISIHINAGPSPEWSSANGWEVYTTRGVTNSDKIADIFYDEHKKAFPEMRMRSDKSDGDFDREADFTVIKAVSCPAILTENFFMTNLEEATLLLTDAFQERIADAHYRAILRIEKM